MPKFIVHYEGRFVEWSTVVDAPVSESMARAEMLTWLTRRYGEVGSEQYPDRLDRAERWGTSSLTPTSASELFVCNRAGDGESTLSDAEVFRQYFAPPKDDKP